MEAGRPSGLHPFGLEAQRVLRLEKRHLIASVDTDALSTALLVGGVDLAARYCAAQQRTLVFVVLDDDRRTLCRFGAHPGAEVVSA